MDIWFQETSVAISFLLKQIYCGR